MVVTFIQLSIRNMQRILNQFFLFSLFGTTWNYELCHWFKHWFLSNNESIKILNQSLFYSMNMWKLYFMKKKFVPSRIVCWISKLNACFIVFFIAVLPTNLCTISTYSALKFNKQYMMHKMLSSNYSCFSKIQKFFVCHWK